jgi:hypothetical protein
MIEIHPSYLFPLNLAFPPIWLKYYQIYSFISQRVSRMNDFHLTAALYRDTHKEIQLCLVSIYGIIEYKSKLIRQYMDQSSK